MTEDLFRATGLTSTETFAPLGKIVNPLIGIDVKLPDACKHCGSNLAVIGAAPIPHRASLHCKECGLFRGWVSNEAFRFVNKIVEQFGKPTEPILIHRGKSEPEDAAGRHGGMR
jgi:hypothetical protein